MIRVKTFSHFSDYGLSEEVQRFLNNLDDVKIISVSFYKNHDYNYGAVATWEEKDDED